MIYERSVKQMGLATAKPDSGERDLEPVPDFQVVTRKAVRQGSFLKKAEVKEWIAVEEDQASSKSRSFTRFGLEEQLLERLSAAGFENPTPIQSKAIPAILNGESCAIQSYTGSGKTLAYILPVLSKAIERAREEWNDASIHLRDKGQLQALVVVPSQELAMQIVRVAETALPGDAKKAIQQLIGGANIHRQIEALKTKPLIAVGTPGRLAELSRKGNLLTHKCPILVLDEVDQLMKSQFGTDMLRVAENTGKKVESRQTIVVSATLTPSMIGKISSWAPEGRFLFIGSQSAIQSPTDPPSLQQTTVPRWGWGNKWSEERSRTGLTIPRRGVVSCCV